MDPLATATDKVETLKCPQQHGVSVNPEVVEYNAGRITALALQSDDESEWPAS